MSKGLFRVDPRILDNIDISLFALIHSISYDETATEDDVVFQDELKRRLVERISARVDSQCKVVNANGMRYHPNGLCQVYSSRSLLTKSTGSNYFASIVLPEYEKKESKEKEKTKKIDYIRILLDDAKHQNVDLALLVAKKYKRSCILSRYTNGTQKGILSSLKEKNAAAAKLIAMDKTALNEITCNEIERNITKYKNIEQEILSALYSMTLDSKSEQEAERIIYDIKYGNFFKYPNSVHLGHCSTISDLYQDIVETNPKTITMLTQVLGLSEKDLLAMTYANLRSMIDRWECTRRITPYSWYDTKIQMKRSMNITKWSDDAIDNVMSQTKAMLDRYSSRKEVVKAIRSVNDNMHNIIDEARSSCDTTPLEIRYRVEAKNLTDPIWESKKQTSIFTEETVDKILAFVESHQAAKLIFAAKFPN